MRVTPATGPAVKPISELYIVSEAFRGEEPACNVTA